MNFKLLWQILAHASPATPTKTEKAYSVNPTKTEQAYSANPTKTE